MKRDMDLIRKLLLRIEDMPAPHRAPVLHFIDANTLQQPDEDLEVIAYHLQLLVQAGFLDETKEGKLFGGITGLTWLGHDFLDSVRNPEIWKRTKEGAAKAGGYTVELLADLAKGFLKTQVEKHTGIKLP